MNRHIIFVMLAILSGVATAQPMGKASVDQIVERLEVPPLKTRGLRNLAPEPRTIDLVIQFDFDSAKLQETSKPLLNNLAAAMKNQRLDGLSFTVEGHTDAKGTEEYNLRLSGRRAETVVNYMAQQGVAKDRLTPIGKGAAELLNTEKPEALENRRVRITTVQ
jgi:outer membrane protein OmpA-like peptidoglycan-associated protein